MNWWRRLGTQGVELLMWLAMRGALTAAGCCVRKVDSNRNYHIPISNTASVVMALENVA